MRIVRCENQNPAFTHSIPHWANLLGDSFLLSPRYANEERAHVAEWSEGAHQYEIRFEVPGLKREEIKLSFESGLLTLKGNKKVRKEGQDQVVAIQKTVAVPEGVDPEKIEAKYEDGILEVILPKREEIKPKEIAIQVK